ncbi:uncharacterized protein LOC119711244 [Motacilla alba alba]|uniref:uncharacterized protein LOC119711244 n=1 Tax=Motacilla alba alba TaxID=1094192 RepID=UPI0018D4F8A7|nr:uncharacterized protein LOC119711244 [Motacilla alba alba]
MQKEWFRPGNDSGGCSHLCHLPVSQPAALALFVPSVRAPGPRTRRSFSHPSLSPPGVTPLPASLPFPRLQLFGNPPSFHQQREAEGCVHAQPALAGAEGLLGFLGAPSQLFLGWGKEDALPQPPAGWGLRGNPRTPKITYRKGFWNSVPGHPNMDSLPKGTTSSFHSKASHLTRNKEFTPDLFQNLQPRPHKPTREAKKTPSSWAGNESCREALRVLLEARAAIPSYSILPPLQRDEKARTETPFSQALPPLGILMGRQINPSADRSKTFIVTTQ